MLAVVLVNATIGYVQEGRAEKALEAIRGMIDPHASVIRGGRRTVIVAEDIVPGDLVLLEPGDRVPADLRLIRARNLRVDEAALTGESVPVDKSVAPAAAEAPLSDRALEEKYFELVNPVLGEPRAKELLARLWNLE